MHTDVGFFQSILFNLEGLTAMRARNQCAIRIVASTGEGVEFEG